MQCDLVGSTYKVLDLEQELGIPPEVSRNAQQAIELVSATGYRVVLVKFRAV